MNKNVNIFSVVSYNMSRDKKIIYKNNKSGIYRINDWNTNQSYVGSTNNISERFRKYYSRKWMLNKLNGSRSIIYSALLKRDYSEFSLDILEYCEVDVLTEREQYYIDHLNPEYNILKRANSRLGSKHSEATKIKIGNSLKSSIIFKNSIKNRPKFKTDETKLKMSLRTRGVRVKLFDLENNLIKEFPTITSVALHFNISSTTVGRYLDKNIPYNGYIFKSNLISK